jgi:cytochrome c biogenesis protein CcmG, thiol:disulfide interchange protein DsbE
VSDRRRWTVGITVVTAFVFGTALVVRLWPQIALVGAGSRAPAFRATDLRTARPATLADYRGRVVLLNVWATWCQPCLVEMPALERLYQRLGGNDFKVVAVSVDVESDSVVLAFARARGLSFDIWHDPSRAIEQIYQTSGVPESFVIERDGRIIKKVIGPAEWDSPVNLALIRRLVTEHPDGQ